MLSNREKVFPIGTPWELGKNKLKTHGFGKKQKTQKTNISKSKTMRTEKEKQRRRRRKTREYLTARVIH